MSKQLVVVTGLSGSGKSSALNALEDQGYYCMDNLPVSLLQAFVQDLMAHPENDYQRIAVGIDARNPANDLNLVPSLIARLQASGMACEILYFEAEDEILLKRFSETRRRHPLTDAEHNLAAAITLERKLLEPLMSTADLRFDTTRTTLHELRRLVQERVAGRETQELSLAIESFGFKHGMPRNADFVFDARCLPNPHWQPALRPLTGRDAPVADFLRADSKVLALRQQLIDFLSEWIPCFEAEGRSYLTVAIGCTGGQHRSVFLVEQITEHFLQQGRKVLKQHRELT